MNNFFYYIWYFFYITFNWNLRLAWFTVYHEIRGEKKYGINTVKINTLNTLSVKGDKEEAEMYQGVNYFLLEKVFGYLQSIHQNKSILDAGCGKGRVLAVAACYGFEKITGIDFAEALCDEARKNMMSYQQKFPEKKITVININAADYVIESDTNVFFFFNPFRKKIMLDVVKNILASVKINSREIYVAYANPVHKEIFISAGFEEVYHFEKLKYVSASVMRL